MHNLDFEDFKEKISADGHEILYLHYFGSHLYGTSTPKSDVDVKGVFLPSMESCLLCNAPRHYTYTSGKEGEKNTSEDIDIQLWSLQYWLELVKKGETNAIDLLYSFTDENGILFKSEKMDKIFKNHRSLFTAKKCNSYVGYAIGQAKKYGVKGTRMGVLKRVLFYLQNHLDVFSSDRLEDIVDFLIKECGDDSYCFLKELTGKTGEKRVYLSLCGAKHDVTITLGEFHERVKSAYDTYGDRAKKAENNEGVDWKALSHAVRAIDQMIELLLDGTIMYPLTSAAKLRRIKEGHYSWKEVEGMIIDGLNEIEDLSETAPEFHSYESEIHRSIIATSY